MDKQHGNRVVSARRRPSGEYTTRQAQGKTLNIKLEKRWP